MTREDERANPLDLTRFSTGAVRSADLAGRRYDLIPAVAARRLAATMAEGAAKYGPRNWEKGIPQTDLINHTLAHVFAYLHGDRSEDHLAHAIANLSFAIHNDEERPELLHGLRNPSTPPADDQAAAEDDH